jgi:hypothetical protein
MVINRFFVHYRSARLLPVLLTAFALNRQNTTGLSETSLLRDTTDALLKDGGDLGRGSLGLGRHIVLLWDGH